MNRIVLLTLFALSGCIGVQGQRVEHLAVASVASDFNTYSIRRVGLLPMIGRTVDQEHAEILQSAFFTELSMQTPFEIVPLRAKDLEEIDHRESYLLGNYEPEMVISLARRFRFDAMFIGTVVDYQFYTPQQLSVEMELVATETGAAIWTGSIQLDGSSNRVRRSIQAFYSDSGAVESEDGEGWELALLSPRLFAQFAAWQIARML